MLNNRWLMDLFYHLKKDYGTSIQYIKLSKGIIDYDTGTHENKRQYFTIDAVLTPKNIFHEYLSKLLGRTEYNKTMFLVQKFSIVLETDDYIVYGNLRYGKLIIENILDTLYIISGENVTNSAAYQIAEVSTLDNLRLNADV